MFPWVALEVFPSLKSSTLLFLSDSVTGVLGLGFGFGLIISFGFADLLSLSSEEVKCSSAVIVNVNK